MRRLLLAPALLAWLGSAALARCRACTGGPAQIPSPVLSAITQSPAPRAGDAFVPQGMNPRPLRLEDLSPFHARLLTIRF